jgi:HSP20 family protein
MSGDRAMSVIKWDPFRGISGLQDRVNDLFEESFGCSGGNDERGLCAWRPLVDIVDTGEGIVLKAEIPGVEKSDVDIEVRDNVLTIRGERRLDPETPEEHYLRRERCLGPFQRSFALHHGVAPDQIRAVFKNGVLEITLPRPQTDKPRRVTIDVD